MSQETTTVVLRTEEDVNALSYYTICKLADALMCVYPMRYIPARITAGDFLGVTLVIDRLGNFVSCELMREPLQMPDYTADMAAEDKAQQRAEDGYRY